MKLLTSVPGMGEVVAVTLISSLPEFRIFSCQIVLNKNLCLAIVFEGKLNLIFKTIALGHI